MSIRFAAVGLHHPHLFNQVNALLAAGAELACFYDEDPAHNAAFLAKYPGIPLAQSLDEILEDSSIQLVTGAAIPDQRAALGFQVMQHGKDYLTAKPGFTTLEQVAEARAVQAETGRFYAVHFGERLGSPSTVKAGELVHSGAIGQVIQTIGLGPHRFLGHVPRPEWSSDKRYFGGVINDLASHQVDQFLYFTSSTSAEIVSAQVGNFKHTQFPNFEDFGDLTLRSPHATGYIRVDWLTPPGLASWGDVRLTILGTEGYIELRKNVDIAGRPNDQHLFLVDQTGTHYIDAAKTPLPYVSQFIHDILNRTETAMSQAHCFLACELALQAQRTAVWLNAPQAETFQPE